MSRLDAVLGRLTMYRTVTLGLGVVLAAAFVLALTGEVGVDPWGLLLGAAVAVGATLAASVVGGLVVRRRAHVESSIVTGLILALLMWPSTEPTALLALAGTGAVAGASKYVLAWRGRHLFNPAAVALVVAGLVAWPLLGVPGAAWWVATPSLLPVLAVVGIAVVARTRHVVPVVAYLLTGLAVVVPDLVSGGESVPAALLTALGSYPLLFAATIMLTEPLTLPPRRWQQGVEGVVVALLTVLPLSLGPLSATPELALVVGNVLGFAWGQRRGARLTVVASRALDGDVHELTFRPSRPLRVAPGQWVELHVPHRGDSRGVRRTFSAIPGPDGTLGVAFRVPTAPSSLKRTLTALEPGAVVDLGAVGGDMLLPRSPQRPVLMVAGGIGVTPFVAMAEQAARQGRDAVLVLLHAGTDAPPYLQRLAATGVRTFVVGPRPVWELPTRWHHLGVDLASADLAAAVPDATARGTYVSGSPQRVAQAAAALRAVGVRRVHRDPFVGYTPPRPGRRGATRGADRQEDGRAGDRAAQAEVTTSATL